MVGRRPRCITTNPGHVVLRTGDFSFGHRDTATGYEASSGRPKAALSGPGRQWLWFAVRKRFHSRVVSIGVRRDLNVYVAGDPAHDLDAVPPAKIPLVVRRLQPDDDLSLLDDVPGLDPTVGANACGPALANDAATFPRPGSPSTPTEQCAS